MLTGSKFELAQRCVGAFTLPQSKRTNDYAEAGKESHAKDEDAINRGEVPAELADAWTGYTWRAEVAFAYDVVTGEGREIGQGIDRDYGDLAWSEFAGTADKVGRLGDSVVIVDKKSFEEATRAAKNPQVRFLALAATRAYKAKQTEVGITHELYPLDRATLGAFDLEDVHEDVKATVLAVYKARKDVRDGIAVPFNTGRHCRWCNAFDNCPKQKELHALVKSGEMSVLVEAAMPYQSDEEASRAFDLWKQIGILHKRIGESIFAHARERPIPIGNGKMFGVDPKPGNEELDGDVTYELLRTKYGQTVADKAVTRETTKKAVREAIKSATATGSVAEAERKFLNELRAAGGVDRKASSAKPREFTPILRAVNE